VYLIQGSEQREPVTNAEAIRAAAPDERQLPALKGLPILVVTAEASAFATASPPTVGFLNAAGGAAGLLHLPDHGVHGNDYGLTYEKNSDAALQPVLAWLDARRPATPVEEDTQMDIGFIGLGRMGIAIARNLAAAGHAVHAWNRSPVPPDTIPGGTIVATPAEAFDADAVFTMLSDDAAIRAVVLDSGALDHMRPGLVHVVTATISVAFAEELTSVHEARGIGYVSAPVFGRPDVAEAAKLNIMAAGAPDALEKVHPLFAVIGQRVFVMGKDPKQANAAKIAGNMMIAMAIEAIAEGVVITEAQGVDRKAFLDLMTQTLFGCRAYENYGGKVLANDYEPGFRLDLGLKDLRLATEAGKASGKHLPMLDIVRNQMSAASDAGMGDRDWSALADHILHG